MNLVYLDPPFNSNSTHNVLFSEQEGTQLSANSVSMALGGGVRVGLEDNIWYDPERTVLATNQALLERMHRLVEVCDHQVMRPTRLRELLNLARGHGEYGRRSSL